MEKEMQAKTPRVLIVARDGSSGGHLDYGRFRMMGEGYDLTVAAPTKKPIQTVVHYPQTIVEYPKEGPIVGYYERPGYIVQAHAAFDDIDPSTFDGLLIPGGRRPEYLQKNKRCLEIVRYFVDSGKAVPGPHDQDIELAGIGRRAGQPRCCWFADAVPVRGPPGLWCYSFAM